MPLTTSIGGAFQRGRLISGQVREDVFEYARVCNIYDVMKPKTASDTEKTMGFATQLASLDDLSELAIGIPPGKSKRVWHKPC